MTRRRIERQVAVAGARRSNYPAAPKPRSSFLRQIARALRASSWVGSDSPGHRRICARSQQCVWRAAETPRLLRRWRGSRAGACRSADTRRPASVRSCRSRGRAGATACLRRCSHGRNRQRQDRGSETITRQVRPKVGRDRVRRRDAERLPMQRDASVCSNLTPQQIRGVLVCHEGSRRRGRERATAFAQERSVSSDRRQRSRSTESSTLACWARA
jgi:hypothetical protein